MKWASSLIALTLLCALCVFCLPANAVEDSTNWSIGSRPSWVIDFGKLPATNRVSSKDSAGELFLVYEEQVNTETQERYCHFAKAILNSSGVQDGSSISVDFDPAYQHLELHSVRVRRGTNSVDELQPSRIKVMQRERDLDRHMYDGSLSAVLFLEDVRTGDTIEYDYTVRGFNPIYKGRVAEIYKLQWGVPVAAQRYRIVSSPERKLHIRQRNGAPAPHLSQTNGFKEYLWDIAETAPAVWEESEPSWFDPTPAIEVSEFETWHDVASWIAPLYVTSRTLPAELSEKIDGWKKASKTPQELAAKALQFVQDEIRYLGIESGVHSHEPTDPQIVYSRRFGDCKDKAMLLCTILESLGLRAHPVAVNDGRRQSIAEWQPTPLAFDHVVVQLVCSNRTYWLDPTSSSQRGRLEDRYFRNFGYGLVIDPATTNLTKIPPYQTGKPDRAVFETFRFLNTNGLVEMTVKTVAHGKEADDLRQQLAESSRTEIEKSYVDYYANYYPSIQQIAPLHIQEDDARNSIETIERYRIINIWKTSTDGQTLSCSFDARTISEVLQIPKRDSRKTPFRLNHPAHREHHIQIFLPEEWSIRNESTNILNKWFRFSFSVRPLRRQVDLDYEYQSLQDVVEVADVPAYYDAISRADDTLDFPVQKPNISALKTPNWALILTSLCFACTLTAGSVWAYRLPKVNRPSVISSEVAPKLVGLRGWLAFFGFCLVIKFFYSLGALPKYMHIFSMEIWHRHADPGGASYHYLWGPTLILQALICISFPVMSGLLLVFYFGERRYFPRLCIGFLVYQAVVILILNLLMRAIGAGDHSFKYVIQTYLGAALWSLYFLKSKRVRATFVR